MYIVYTEESVFETIPLSEDDVFSLVLSLVRFGEEKFEEETRGGNASREGSANRVGRVERAFVGRAWSS